MKIVKRRKYRWKRIAAAVAGIAAVVLLGTGALSTPVVDKEVIYRVREGDTLRDISEKHLKLNTANRKYILQFEYEIIQANPWLKECDYIYPGQEIRIPFQVRADEAR